MYMISYVSVCVYTFLSICLLMRFLFSFFVVGNFKYHTEFILISLLFFCIKMYYSTNLFLF